MDFALKLRRTPKQDITSRVHRTGEKLGLERLLRRKPRELSGGQRQRVALGRAIVRDPKVFLMDEPLSNLDAKLRGQTRAEIARLQRELGTTTVYVTHDQVEAMTIGTRIAVMSEGVLQQVARPSAIYREPANTFVASFIGSSPKNLIESRFDAASGAMTLGDARLPVPPRIRALADGRARFTLGVRPEHFALTASGASGEASAAVPNGTLRCVTELIESHGSDLFVHASFDRGAPTSNGSIIARLHPDAAVSAGQPIALSIDWDRVIPFDPETGENLAARALPG